MMKMSLYGVFVAVTKMQDDRFKNLPNWQWGSSRAQSESRFRFVGQS